MKYWRVHVTKKPDEGISTEEIDEQQFRRRETDHVCTSCGQHKSWYIFTEAETGVDAVRKARKSHELVQQLVNQKRMLEPIWRDVVKAYIKIVEDNKERWSADEPDWYTELSIRVADLVYKFNRGYREGLVGIAALTIIGIKSLDDKRKKCGS